MTRWWRKWRMRRRLLSACSPHSTINRDEHARAVLHTVMGLRRG